MEVLFFFFPVMKGLEIPKACFIFLLAQVYIKVSKLTAACYNLTESVIT